MKNLPLDWPVVTAREAQLLYSSMCFPDEAAHVLRDLELVQLAHPDVHDVLHYLLHRMTDEPADFATLREMITDPDLRARMEIAGVSDDIPPDDPPLPRQADEAAQTIRRCMDRILEEATG